MADAEKKFPDWFSAMLPKIAKKLGKDPLKLNYEFSTSLQLVFQSTVYFVTLKDIDEDSCSKDNPVNAVNIVIKKFPDAEVPEFLCIKEQFHNEIVFYEKFSKHIRNCPRWIYLQEGSPSNTIIVLENMATRGMRSVREKMNISYNHAVTALKEIARFHADAYIMKERYREEFFKSVGELQEYRYTGNVLLDTRYKKFIDLTAPRSIRYLQKKGHHKEFCDKVESLFENAYDDILCKAATPSEPLATLCHGDFTINNVLCKEVEGNYEMVLIDFAMIRYSNPAVDLSTFLFLQCSVEMRKAKLREFLRIYQEELVRHLEEAGIENLERFSYEALYDDFIRKAAFGFVISTFFLSFLMDDAESADMQDMFKLEIEKVAEINLALGGDQISEVLADGLLELKEIGTFDEVLQNTN